MAAEIKRDPDLEWLGHVQPVGLVIAPLLIKELGLTPLRQTQADSAVVAAHVNGDASEPALRDPWAFVAQVLGWEAKHVAGSPGGPAVPDALHVRLPEHDTTLGPTWAVAELGEGEQPWQLLVRIEAPGVDPDARAMLGGWEATPHQRFERLLRETGIHAGVLVTEKNVRTDGEDCYVPELRVVYAPRGETSGHLSFPLRDLATVAGRPMLGGLKLLLDSFRLFADAPDRRLPALLKQSREAQAAVSTELAGQVLGALHELLRGLDAAAPELIRALARERPAHLYEGLLTVLMRLVFILYAEDRDLLPSRGDGRSRKIYETSYSLRGLYEKLVEDAALNPDTMDERRGAWGRLLALFRLIHRGHHSHFVQARGGKLFDAEQFPFLEGRADGQAAPAVPTVSDGCVLRILEGLMTLQVKGGGRERLSYRTLDVEQIGSVYETVMGFTVEAAAGRSLAIKAGKHNRTPVFVDLNQLLAAKGKDRIKYLKEEAERGALSPSVGKAVEAANSVADLAAALDAIVDERGSPRKHESAAGTPILQPTDERRRTGSHYTPRSLTEPIVRHALEPAFERLEPNATPEQILDLKVCDMAMGSGAFLVEACRQLAARLVAAWDVHKDKKPIIPPDEDEDLHARRLVTQRCLYGVDKNPLATDLAKLSLWLATLARDHEFTFLDHALKSGDSLVGLALAQIAAAHWDASKPGLPLFRQLVKDRIVEAMKGRAQIQAAPDDTARAIQEARHRSLEDRLKHIRLIGDAVIAAFFAADKPKSREKKRAGVESWLTGSMEADWDKLRPMAATLQHGEHPLTPFHWEIEFPEVFAQENGGFDAIVGNPPFLGGARISEEFGRRHFSWLIERFTGCRHQCDLAGYFFRLAFERINNSGCCGLLATKTLSEGDTREGSLVQIIRQGGIIYRATTRYRWPGEASTIVNIVHFSKSKTKYEAILNDLTVPRISAYLRRGAVDERPNKLGQNPFYSKGSLIYGQGFLFDDNDVKATPVSMMTHILKSRPDLQPRILPFIGGEDVNRDSRHQSRRFVIDLNDVKSESDLVRFSPLADILVEKVRPERLALGDNPNNRPLKNRWWAHQAHRPKLYAKIGRLRRVLGIARVTPHVAFTFLPTDVTFAEKVILFEIDGFALFAILQSRIHEIWVRFLTSTLGDTLNYAATDCYENFPFCQVEQPIALHSLEIIGQDYYAHRATLMVARNEGMTKTYNRFHGRAETSEDIARLRELHAAMDRAVLEAYGWHDLAARAEPAFLDETNEDDHTYQGRLFWPSDFRDDVLARLLALNAERHAEEIRLGIAPGMKRTKKGDAEEGEDDLEILATDEEE
jgi:hypothetical protein